jgi:Ca2+/Na+ antiporter
MLDFIDSYLLTPYIQAIIFIILVGLFWLQHRKFKLASSGFNWLRTIILLVLFLYFAWNWATSISGVISRFSILGMFFINMYMVYNLVLGALDEKYRQALDAYGRNVVNKSLIEAVWSAGKKYVYTRYFFDALFSGYSPRSFLKAVVSRQITADMQTILVKQGLGQELITTQKLMAFLTHTLNQTQAVPQELKDILAQVIKQFGEHTWIQEQVNEFLRLALKDPEKLYEATWNGTPPEGK